MSARPRIPRSPAKARPRPCRAELPPRAPGRPSWITDELVGRTLRVWQRYYAHTLSEAEAVTMILAAAGLGGAPADEHLVARPGRGRPGSLETP